MYDLDIGRDDFYSDCLFYNFKIRSFVVIDVKTGKLQPAYSGHTQFIFNSE